MPGESPLWKVAGTLLKYCQIYQDCGCFHLGTRNSPLSMWIEGTGKTHKCTVDAVSVCCGFTILLIAGS